MHRDAAREYQISELEKAPLPTTPLVLVLEPDAPLQKDPRELVSDPAEPTSSLM